MWTPARSPTFFERAKLTWTLLSLRWPLRAASLMALWSSGATVSFNQIVPGRHAKLRIVSGNKQSVITLTARKPPDSVTVTAE